MRASIERIDGVACVVIEGSVIAVGDILEAEKIADAVNSGEEMNAAK